MSRPVRKSAPQSVDYTREEWKGYPTIELILEQRQSDGFWMSVIRVCLGLLLSSLVARFVIMPTLSWWWQLVVSNQLTSDLVSVVIVGVIAVAVGTFAMGLWRRGSKRRANCLEVDCMQVKPLHKLGRSTRKTQRGREKSQRSTGK